MDWVGPEPPTADDISGRPLLKVCGAYIRTITEPGGVVLGERPLELDGIVPPTDCSQLWGFRGAVLQAERHFIAGDPPPQGERREVKSPLTDEMLRPVRTGCGDIQFASPLADDDFQKLADWLRPYPEMRVRAYGRHSDLEFLRYFPFLRHYDMRQLQPADFAPLVGLPHLKAVSTRIGIKKSDAVRALLGLPEV